MPTSNRSIPISGREEPIWRYDEVSGRYACLKMTLRHQCKQRWMHDNCLSGGYGIITFKNSKGSLELDESFFARSIGRNRNAMLRKRKQGLSYTSIHYHITVRVNVILAYWKGEWDTNEQKNKMRASSMPQASTQTNARAYQWSPITLYRRLKSLSFCRDRQTVG